ncbi:hypothetical protein PHMEG_00017565 [Phytophthora megakarya]|uniref:Uncharacterized protein n=1 Tax=Phytophthora megakarya TaxID=4795 RepID=A0A225VWI2_9STRA|nr:hypothetical protein PHMEG_00017565 [Phytophthora megakarya]
MESLGLDEMARLADQVADDGDIQDFIFTPREASRFDGDLDEAVKSVESQREMASTCSRSTVATRLWSDVRSPKGDRGKHHAETTIGCS